VTRAARRGVRCRASLQAADNDHLVPRPDSDGEGAGAATQDRVGAVVEQLKGGIRTLRWTQMRGVESNSAGSSLGRPVLELCLGKEGAETCKVLENFLTIMSIESSSFCKNSFGKTICAPKTASAQLGCALSPRSTKGNSSDHVTAAAHARSVSLRRRCNLWTAPFDLGW
jgi:hypothetical protein